jgi:hypothetical protein
VRNPACLKDCGEQWHPCVKSLLRDVRNKGMCYNLAEFEGVDISDSCVFDSDTNIVTGTCSTMTQELLTQPECVRAIAEQPGYIWLSIELLVYDSCSANVYNIYFDISAGIRVRCSAGSYFI